MYDLIKLKFTLILIEAAPARVPCALRQTWVHLFNIGTWAWLLTSLGIDVAMTLLGAIYESLVSSCLHLFILWFIISGARGIYDFLNFGGRAENCALSVPLKSESKENVSFSVKK